MKIRKWKLELGNGKWKWEMEIGNWLMVIVNWSTVEFIFNE